MSAAAVVMLRPEKTALEGDAASARIAECFEVIGGRRDEFAFVWEEQATNKDRRLMLVMAGEPMTLAARKAGRAWLDLPANQRGDIKRAVAKFKAWAERLQ